MNLKINKSKEENNITHEFNYSNIKIKSKTFGEVELKYISAYDSTFLIELLGKVKNDKEFVIQALYHQLITPKISLTKFNKIPDNELIEITRGFVENEQHIFQYFRETTDKEFFTNFRKAIKTYYQKQVERLQTTLGPMIEKYQLTAHIVSEYLAPQINFWQNWVEQNKAILNSYVKFWQNFQQQYKISEQEAIQILRKYKWFITPSLPLNFIFEMVKIGRRKGNQRKAINRLFINYFSSNNFENLEKLVDEWQTNNIFKPRMKIFRDSVSVMKNAKNKYNPSTIVLPTLIAQIDGIRIEFMKRNGLSFRTKNSTWKKWFKDQTSNQKLLNLANDVFLNILFQKSQPGRQLDTPFVFNRHKIMHGEYLRYGRIDHTIRAFLILDFLATLSNRE